MITFIDWFAGIGSMTLAFERAGAVCRLRVESEEWKNMCGLTSVPTHGWQLDVFEDRIPQRVDIWLASTGGPDLVRWGLHVLQYPPRCLVVESGPQARMGDFLEQINSTYFWTYTPGLDSRDFGLVQRRVRPYAVAYRKDVNKHATWLGSRPAAQADYLHVTPAPEEYENVTHAELAQGLPAGYTEPCGDRHHRDLALNAASAVPVVEWIARCVMEDLT